MVVTEIRPKPASTSLKHPFDSVFGEFVEFAEEELTPKSVAKDTTILPVEGIKKTLSTLEKKAATLFSKTYDEYIDRAVLDLTNKEDPLKAIANYKWGLGIELDKNLWAEWILGMSQGGADGDREIELSSNLAKFTIETPDHVAYFRQEPEIAQLRNLPAERAIRERNQRVASDVTNSEWLEIKNALMDAVRPPSATAPPISRSELLKRINEILGEKKNRFRNRALKIARTELTFAYNAGRLDSYVRSGVVEAIKFISILDDRRCPQCESRQGLMARLDQPREIARLMPPIHVMCRCVVSPVLLTEFTQEYKKSERQIKKRNIVTEVTPWAMGGILAAILLGVASKGRVTTKAATQATTQAAPLDIAAAIAAQKLAAKTPQPVSRKVVQPLLLGVAKPPIMLSGTIDLQTATYAELRSLFTRKQLSDTLIYRILTYRDRFGLNSVDDLRNVIGIGDIRLKPFQILGRENQIFTFLDPKINQSALVLWSKSPNILTKSQATKIHNLMKSGEIRNLKQLKEALNKNGIDDQLIEKLKELAQQEKQRQLEAIKQTKVEKGGAIVPVRQGITAITRIGTTVSKDQRTKLATQASKKARLRGIDATLDDIEGQISLLRSRIQLQVRKNQQQLGLQDDINASTLGVTRAQTISQELIEELKPYANRVTGLNTRIKDLEDKLGALLNPAVDDYFTVRPQVIREVREEIFTLRGEVNKVNRFTNLETRAARDRANKLRLGQKRLKSSLPDYSEISASIEAQLEEIVAQLNIESLKPGSTTIIAALRAKYSSLGNQLEIIESFRLNPLKQYIADKKIIGQYLGQAKKEAKNLSRRLANLETRIAALPTRVSQLSLRVRTSYRKMPTAITRSADYQPPIRSTPGIKGKQARLVKASRSQRQAGINNQVTSIETQVSSLVTNADEQFLNTKNWKKQSIKKQISLRVDRYEEQLIKNIQLQQNLTITAKKSSTIVINVETSIDDLMRKVQQDIYEPLGDNWFSARGVIKANNLQTIKEVRKQINQEISQINKQLSSLKNSKAQVSQLKKELTQIRKQTQGIAIAPEAKERLNRQIERVLAELEELTKFEVGAKYYNKILPQHRQTLENFLSGNSPALRSQVASNLDELIAKVNTLETSLTQASNAGAIANLTQAKGRLQVQLNRIKSLPKKVKNLPESAQIEWQGTRSLRKTTQKAKQKLDRSVAKFQQEASKQGNQLANLTETIDEVVADLETPLDIQGKPLQSVYRQELQEAIKKQQDRIKIAIADLDDNAKLLRLATNREQGLDLIYANLKQIYESNIPGLIPLTEKSFPVGIDEAMEVKRQVIKVLTKRGKSLEKKLANILKEKPALAVTRYKKGIIDSQIKALEDLQGAIARQKPLAEDIEKKLKGVFFADPAYHREIKPAKILEEIQERAVTQATGIKQQLIRLKKAQAELADDLQRKITYGIRDKKIIELREGIPIEIMRPSATVDAKGIKKIVDKYKEEVVGLTKSRRPQLEEIGIYLKSKRVKLYGENSITENLKLGKKLTNGQQKAFNAMTGAQQEFLREVSVTGTFDLYDDLYKYSVVKGKLDEDEIEPIKSIFAKLGLTDSKRIKRKSAKTKKFEEVSGHLNKLKGMGYQGLEIEIAEDGAKFIGITKPPESLVARTEWELLRKKLGVDRQGNPIAVKNSKIAGISNGTINVEDLSDISYNELLNAIAANRQLRYEVNNRLAAFNFSIYLHNVIYLTGTINNGNKHTFNVNN